MGAQWMAVGEGDVVIDRERLVRAVRLAVLALLVVGFALTIAGGWSSGATAAPCLPSAVRVDLGILEMVFLLLAAFCAFFTLRLAACRCFCVAMQQIYPSSLGGHRLGPLVVGLSARLALHLVDEVDLLG